MDSYETPWQVQPPGSIGSIQYRMQRKFLWFFERAFFVGDRGYARFTKWWGGMKKQVVLFSDVEHLVFEKVDQFVNGIYSGTTYSLRPYDLNWKRLGLDTGMASLRGSFKNKGKAPKKNSPYYFALAVQSAWSNYKVKRMEENLDSKGAVRFYIPRLTWRGLKYYDWVEIRKGKKFALNWKGKEFEWTKDEVSEFLLANGKMTVKSSKHGDKTFMVSGMTEQAIFFDFMARYFDTVW